MLAKVFIFHNIYEYCRRIRQKFSIITWKYEKRHSLQETLNLVLGLWIKWKTVHSCRKGILRVLLLDTLRPWPMSRALYICLLFPISLLLSVMIPYLFFSQAVSYDYINEEASRLEALSICHMFQKSDISVGFGINYKLYWVYLLAWEWRIFFS